MARHIGTGSRMGAVSGRTQIENPATGDWVKRDESKDSSHRGEVDVKEDGKPFKGVANQPDGRRTKTS